MSCMHHDDSSIKLVQGYKMSYCNNIALFVHTLQSLVRQGNIAPNRHVKQLSAKRLDNVGPVIKDHS